MAKTLVIKGANFSTNKVTTIEFADIPCTAISLSEDTLSFTDYDAETLTATLTPNDTTDELIWESSDTSVATVVDGVVTPVGLGSCTITATCGEVSDTATVTVAFAYISDVEFALATYGSSDHIAGYSHPDYNYLYFFGVDEQATEKILAATSTMVSSGGKAIKLPPNTAKVKVNITDRTGIYNNQWSGNVTWFSDVALDAEHPTFITRISASFFNLSTEQNLTFTVPEGADSVILNVHLASAASSGDDPDTYVESIGLGIEFLADES